MQLNKKYFWKSQTHFCWECYELDMGQNAEKRVNPLMTGGNKKVTQT